MHLIILNILGFSRFMGILWLNYVHGDLCMLKLISDVHESVCLLRWYAQFVMNMCITPFVCTIDGVVNMLVLSYE